MTAPLLTAVQTALALLRNQEPKRAEQVLEAAVQGAIGEASERYERAMARVREIERDWDEQRDAAQRSYLAMRGCSSGPEWVQVLAEHKP